MLRFTQPPDAVFLAILHDAVEDLKETLTDLAAEDWPALYPLAARCFSLDLARTTLAELLTASRAPALYQLTDYHWLLGSLTVAAALGTFAFLFMLTEGGV